MLVTDKGGRLREKRRGGDRMKLAPRIIPLFDPQHVYYVKRLEMDGHNVYVERDDGKERVTIHYKRCMKDLQEALQVLRKEHPRVRFEALRDGGD